MGHSGKGPDILRHHALACPQLSQGQTGVAAIPLCVGRTHSCRRSPPGSFPLGGPPHAVASAPPPWGRTPRPRRCSGLLPQGGAPEPRDAASNQGAELTPGQATVTARMSLVVKEI